MAIKIIDVKQVRGNFYGGLAYRVSWSFGGELEPSKLTIEVVNEEGKYGKPALSLREKETIEIGKFKFEGYLVSYSLNTVAEQKTLTLEYVDEAILLDKYWVGLNQQQADKRGVIPPNTIIVGKQYHPCDINMDSNIDYVESDIRLIDPCDPCPFSPVDKYKEACDPRIEKIDDLETFYTFSELIEKIKDTIPSLNIKLDASNLYLYKAQHIGDLRSVLSSWCSDLGLIFYWDPIKKELVFKSRNRFNQNPLTYDEILKIENVMEINYSENILDTFSQGFIGTYERAGGLEKYPCRESTWKMLRPLTVSDFFLSEPKPLKSKYAGPLSPRAVAIAFSYYSSSLRDAFLWFSHYGIIKAQDAQDYIFSSSSSSSSVPSSSSSSPSSSSSSPTRERVKSEPKEEKPKSDSETQVKGNQYQPEINSIPEAVFDYNTNDNVTINDLTSSQSGFGDPTVLKHFGNMVIKKVFAQDSQDPESVSGFGELKKVMPPELKKLYDNFQIGASPGYYFFAAEVSEDGYDQAVNVDRELATQMLGKLYFNKFRSIVTGASDDESECDVQTPDEDASGQWFKAKQGVENMKIFSFGHDENSLIDKLKKSINKDIQENEKTDSKRLGNQGINKNPEDYVANSFILVTRNGPKWSPEKEFADKWFGSFYSWWGERIFKKFKDSNGRPDELFALVPEAVINENIKLFIVRELPQGFKLKFTKKRHPLETKGGSKVRIEEDENGKQFSINEGSWGLLSTDGYEINIDDSMPIFAPPGSFIEELDVYEDESQTAPSYSLLNDELYAPASTDYAGPGYRSFIECSSEFPKLKTKFKHLMFLPALDAADVCKVSYVNYELSENNNLALFGDSCIPDRDKLNTYLQDLGSTSQYGYKDPFFQINFKLADIIPQLWTIEQGFSSVSVEVTENGTITNYGFSTKLIQPPSISFIEQNFRNQRRAAFGNKIGLLTSVKAKSIRH